MRKNLAIGFLTLIFLIPTVSQAARDYGRNAVDEFFGEVYFIVKYGEVTIGADLPESGSDIRNLGFAFGKGINDVLSMEVEYNFTVSVDDDYFGSGVDAEADTLGLFLVAKTDGDLYLKGRIGYTRLTQTFGSDISFVSNDLEGSSNVYGVAVGLAGGIKFGSNHAIEIEYTRYPTRDDITIDLGTFIGEVDFDFETDIVYLNYVWSLE